MGIAMVQPATTLPEGTTPLERSGEHTPLGPCAEEQRTHWTFPRLAAARHTVYQTQGARLPLELFYPRHFFLVTPKLRLEHRIS